MTLLPIFWFFLSMRGKSTPPPPHSALPCFQTVLVTGRYQQCYNVPVACTIATVLWSHSLTQKTSHIFHTKICKGYNYKDDLKSSISVLESRNYLISAPAPLFSLFWLRLQLNFQSYVATLKCIIRVL